MVTLVEHEIRAGDDRLGFGCCGYPQLGNQRLRRHLRGFNLSIRLVVTLTGAIVPSPELGAFGLARASRELADTNDASWPSRVGCCCWPSGRFETVAWVRLLRLGG